MNYVNPLHRLYQATRYSLNGLYHAFKKEQAFAYEAVILCLLAALCIVFRLSWVRVLTLMGAWLMVMALELVNSAVEKAFDLISREYHQDIKAGKDMLSASVFLMISLNMGLWVFLFLGR